MADIHVADIGTVFRLTLTKVDGTPLDVSTASVKQMIFSKPTQGVLTVTASLLNDGTDGKIFYISVSGDLSEAGSWKIQGFVTTPDGSWHSDEGKFKVKPNLN